MTDLTDEMAAIRANTRPVRWGDRERRIHDLGMTIWDRVVKIEAYLVAQNQLPALVGELERMRKAEQIALWGDLQTLFRGMVFPDEIDHTDPEDEGGPVS